MARLPSWAETGEVNTAKLVCNLAARKPWPHPKGTGAAELGKHPVEIGHDEIEARFAPMARRLGVDPDVHPGIYFLPYFGKFRSSTLSQGLTAKQRAADRLLAIQLLAIQLLSIQLLSIQLLSGFL